MKVVFRRGFLDITLLFIVVVIALGAILTTGFKSKSERGTESLVPEAQPAGEEKRSLQLRALKFKKCSETITLDLLLDRTGSMGQNTPSGKKKIERLKEAVLALTNNLLDDSVIGIQSFSRKTTGADDIREDVPISFYRDVKSIIPTKVNAYTADGSTPTHNALVFSYDKLREAIPRFPGRQFNFVLVSDGAPCPGVGCPNLSGANQDPRLYNPNPADQIKALGVNVYALAIYDRSQVGNPVLANLLKSIASKPENYFQAESADDTTRLLTSISEKICQAAQAQAEN